MLLGLMDTVVRVARTAGPGTVGLEAWYSPAVSQLKDLGICDSPIILPIKVAILERQNPYKFKKCNYCC